MEDKTARQATEMKYAADLVNSYKLFHIIRVTVKRALYVNKIVYEADDSLIRNRGGRRFVLRGKNTLDIF